MASKREKLQQLALDLLDKEPSGIRYSELVRKVHDRTNENLNTVHGAITHLDRSFPSRAVRPSRGLLMSTAFTSYCATSEADTTIVEVKEPEAAFDGTIPEVELYEPFRDYLLNDLEECTKAIALGGNRFRDKWGTPDVIGKLEARPSDIIKMPTEIVAAEIKSDTSALITAFGQACAYKLFCHRVYIVVPKESSGDDIAKLDVLGRTMGIGLILWAKSDEGFRFEIKVRAAKHEPDFFYMNRYLKLVEAELFG